MVISVAAYSFMNISKVKQAIQFVSITIFEKVRYWSDTQKPHSKIITSI